MAYRIWVHIRLSDLVEVTIEDTEIHVKRLNTETDTRVHHGHGHMYAATSFQNLAFY